MKYLVGSFILWLTISSCSKEEKTLFFIVDPQESGISFRNDLKENEEFNILNYMYFYNGGGVAIGDINNDGFSDIYFSSNIESNKLYLNKGNFEFEDITAKAGVAAESGWKTGIAMTDVNGDGLLDIYVCKVGTHFNATSKNQLFINNGDLSFSEKASEWGVDFQGYSTQSAFFDYDKDGDLDMYLLNHSVHSKGTYGPIDFRKKKVNDTGDRLYRNDGNKFTDVTESAGIYSSVLGYGLGVAISDLNNDGWQDIYISNDFHENDFLYYNNQDGTFTEGIEKSMGHTSRFSMGNDAADINNDGWSDIISTDMQAEDETVLKSSEGPEPYEIYQFKLSYGYNHQYPRNALQLNSGMQMPVNKKGIKANLFSEIGQIAAVSSTDWSWATLFCDFDNDGNKDLFISNGIMRRPNDLDYLKYISGNITQASLQSGNNQNNIAIINKMPSGKVANYLYRNEGNLKFKNNTKDWGINFPTLSNGAAYSDLDNDGDNDLVINNLNDYPTVMKNNSSDFKTNNFLKILLQGEHKNKLGLGARIEVTSGDKKFYYEQSLTRGFESSIDPALAIGVGKARKVDTLTITWNCGKSQILTNVEVNQKIILKEHEAVKISNVTGKEKVDGIFQLEKEFSVLFSHKENRYNDFNIEILLPYSKSAQGPKIAVSDINNDGKEDFFICGASGQPGEIFVQTPNSFSPVKNNLLAQDSSFEDVDAEWIDVDNDKDLDLYVVSGGYQMGPHSPQDRLYINEGNDSEGIPKFKRSNGLPKIFKNGSCIAADDFDKDGDIDLFIGTGGEPGFYGVSQKNHLLENDGKGNFRDVTAEFATDLQSLGMVTDAIFTDIDEDGNKELLLAGEWMPITVFKYVKKKFVQVTVQSGLGKSNGWWNCIEVDDIDNDGDVDLIAGNLGLNSIIKASAKEPATLLVKDFDGNGRSEAILSYYKNGKLYPFNNKDELSAQMVLLKKLYPSYSSFAGKTTDQVFPKQILTGAIKKQAYSFASSIFINDGKGNFTQKELPLEAQISPIFSIYCADLDGDGFKDLTLGGNLYRVGPAQGRYDASYGMFLKGNRTDGFLPVSGKRANLMVQGEVRDIKEIKIAKRKYLLFGRNNEALQLWRISN